MEIYPMENSDSIWEWCKARKKLFTMNKIHPVADGFSSVAKIGSLAYGSSPNISRRGNQCIEDSTLCRSSATFEGNSSKSGASYRDTCLPVKNLIAEVGPFKNGDSIKSPISVFPHHVSETNSNTVPNHPDGDSGLEVQFLSQILGIADESFVVGPAFYEKKQASKSRVWRKAQKRALEQNKLFSDGVMKRSSSQYAACNRGPFVKTSSSSLICKAFAEDMEFRSPSMNGEMRDLSSNYSDWPCHTPATKKPKKDRGLVSETSKSPFQIENQRAKSEFLFPGLHLLADMAVRSQENHQSRFPENITQKKRIRKTMFIPTEVPFLQKKVARRTKSALKHHHPDALQTLYDLQKNLSSANSKPILTADNICRLRDTACIRQTENQVFGNGVDEDLIVIPQSRCSNRSRSQRLPSKYCDSVLQPWKRRTR